MRGFPPHHLCAKRLKEEMRKHLDPPAAGARGSVRGAAEAPLTIHGERRRREVNLRRAP